MAQRLRTSKGPCQPFGTGQISPHAALSPPYWVHTQLRRLRHTFRGNCRGRGHVKYSDRLLLEWQPHVVFRETGERCGGACQIVELGKLQATPEGFVRKFVCNGREPP